VKNFNNLLTPLKFLRIKSAGLFWYQWTAPTIICAASLLVYGISPIEIKIFGDYGVIRGLNTFYSVVIGFYIAGLAAVSTFPSAHLDKEISGHPTVLVSYKGGSSSEEKLTRRRLMAYVFGYCVFLAIILLITGTIASGTSFVGDVEDFKLIVQYFFVVFYVYCSSSLLVATLFMLHYLTERMHRE